MSVETRVLAELSEDRYSSGEAISNKLNITRSAVWKHIMKLRQRGYVIEAAPRHGYRLASRPDKLLPAEIQPLLKTRVVGRELVHFESVSSTADAARTLIDDGASEGTVVIAETQSAGRGRMGRTWQTPAGQAIAMSVILYPKLVPTKTPLLSLATALAVKRAVEATIKTETGQAVGIALKWPNDIYLSGRKLGGVLVEMAAELDRVKWAIDSIGLNVNNSFQGTLLEGKATSLAAELGAPVSRRVLVAAILGELDQAYTLSHSEKGLISLQREFEKHDMLQGKKVDVMTPEGTISGVAMGIDDEGRLLVYAADGRVKSIFSGEATLSGSGELL